MVLKYYLKTMFMKLPDPKILNIMRNIQKIHFYLAKGLAGELGLGMVIIDCVTEVIQTALVVSQNCFHLKILVL